MKKSSWEILSTQHTKEKQMTKLVNQMHIAQAHTVGKYFLKNAALAEKILMRKNT